jgi:hypothetical protein
VLHDAPGGKIAPSVLAADFARLGERGKPKLAPQRD